jgi:heme A synthase
VVIALVTTNFWQTLTNQRIDPQEFAPIKTLAITITIAIYVQLALGATMRHQHRDLAILDFPTANGAWIPDTGAAALAKINAWRDARGLSDVTAFKSGYKWRTGSSPCYRYCLIAFCLRVRNASRSLH